MKQTVISKKVKINASKDKVWDALADFGNVQNLSPNISKSYSTTDQKNGVGAERHCDFTMMGANVEERITEWNEGRSMKIEIYKTNKLPMVRGMNAEFVISGDNKQSEVQGVFKYHMNNALGNMMNNLKMKKMNTANWELFLAGIKHNLETGESVGKETQLDKSIVTEA